MNLRVLFSVVSVLFAPVCWSDGLADERYVAKFLENPVAIYGDIARYEVFRNNKRVGDHSLEFVRQGKGLEVRVVSDLSVKYLGIPVYTYSYTATEKWESGKLQSVTSVIRDNRKDPRKIVATMRGRLLEIADRGRVRTAPRAVYPSNHWHPGVLEVKRVYHTLHAKVHVVRIEALGNEKIELTGGADSKISAMIDAKKYAYTGGFDAHVWYDERLRWVRLQFNADDGSTIDYRCTTCLDP